MLKRNNRTKNAGTSRDLMAYRLRPGAKWAINSPIMFLFKDKTSWRQPTYNLQEEIAASITHGIGAGLSIAGLVILIVLGIIYGDVWQVVAFSIYGTSLILLYFASTLYHAVQDPGKKRIFRILDHTAIYLLIAGTYTPFLLVRMRGTMGWTLFAVVWAMALAGIIWKIFFLGRMEILATIFYVVMGLMAVVGINEMLISIPTSGLILLVIGGAVYILGIIFYAWEGLPYNHVIWHLFVLVASVLHFFAIATLI
jgi:hemolysin III